MEVRRSRVSTSVRTEGGLLPADLLAKIAAAEPDVPGLKDADFGLGAGERFREAITRSWNRLVGAWAALEAVRVAAESADALTGATRDRFLMPLFEELGFGRLPVARRVEIDGTTYPISHLYGDRVPVHLVGFGVDLDSRSKGVRGAAGAAPHALMQEFLNRTDWSLWGLVSNGRTLRLLRDSTTLTRQAYVEFDLDSIFTGELYADFALLWSVCHRSRFEGDRPSDCLLEQWTQKSAEDGTRALDKLRSGVEQAIETLGAGFLAHPANRTLRDALRTGQFDQQDYYRELLRLVYRLIFLFAAEDRRDEQSGRELLLDPNAPEEAAERYRRFYSTARLRSFAGRRRGTRHPDLWVSFRRVAAALGSDGAPSLALPSLGSFLFGPVACEHLDVAELKNEDLLAAVRSLATIEEYRRLRLVDYRNLGAEELGGVYEGLLELRPSMDAAATPPKFKLGAVGGNERKSSGSYYTPTSLINNLLDSALEPSIERAIGDKTAADAENAILDMSVVDPAAGSGHFLVAAAHRMAKRLAAIRTGEGEPPPTAVRRALREVIARCIYAVDRNPMAVELCKVSLWLEALEPGKPLTFLDAHVRRGNSLLGTTPNLADAGIPDAAFRAIAGDETLIARSWRDRNRRERGGQQALHEAGLMLPIAALTATVAALDELSEETPNAVVLKAAQHAAYEASSEYQRSRAALDTWCAAFVARKTTNAPPITTANVRSMSMDPAVVSPEVREVVSRAADDYAFFHWPIEFPDVLARGGFDVVLGNPPWERLELEETEFFAGSRPEIAAASTATKRKRLIAALEKEDSELFDRFREAERHLEAEAHLIRSSSAFNYAARGRLNTYALFAELAVSLRGQRGRIGIIVPTGIATDDSLQGFFSSLVETGSLISLFDFRNAGFFRDVAGAQGVRFCLLTLGQPGSATRPAFLFRGEDLAELEDRDRLLQLDLGDLVLFNPNTRTCPMFMRRRDHELAAAIYHRHPILRETREGGANLWEVSFQQGTLNISSDSALFRETGGPGRVPVFEAKMVHQFDHRFGTFSGLRRGDKEVRQLPRPTVVELRDPAYAVEPRYWIEQAELDEQLSKHDAPWLLGWRDVTAATPDTVRTVIAAALPRVAVAHNMPLVFSTLGTYGLLVANLNAFVLDWIARQKVGGTHLTFGILEQLPILPPSALNVRAGWSSLQVGDVVRRYVVELSYTSKHLASFARSLGWIGAPFRWDADRRARLRAELDAIYFHLYGLDGDDVAYVMDSFPTVRKQDIAAHGHYRSSDWVLEAYHAIASATEANPFTSHLDPEPGDPRASHAPGTEYAWSPWDEVSLLPGPMAHAPAASPPFMRQGAVPSPMEATLPSSAPSTRKATTQPSAPASEWNVEAGVDFRTLVPGTLVRHRVFGRGVLLTVHPTRTSAELLVRFDGQGEKWIAFGLGLLEFPNAADPDG
jgi:hypothetical protein